MSVARIVCSAVAAATIATLVSACIGDGPPAFSDPEDDASELWTTCELPAVAKLSRGDLNPDLEADGGAERIICGSTKLAYGARSCDKPRIVIDPRVDCTGEESTCCILMHEAVHVAQLECLCGVCSASTDSTETFNDCMDCSSTYCHPEMEATALHVECQLSSACHPGEKGKGGQPPSPDADIPEGSDPGLSCFAEWKYCRDVLAKRELPPTCRGVTPDCGRVVEMKDLQCGCGTAADRTYGCHLECPGGRTCTFDAIGGGCACR